MGTDSLGARIKHARKSAGLSQAELGAVFGITREAVAQWESNKNSPTAGKLGRIAIETQVRAEWLISGQGEIRGTAPPMATLPADPGERARIRDGRIPIKGLGWGGADGHLEWNGEEVGFVDRPPFLAGATGAYAIYHRGSSMVPRYDEGQLLYIDPGRPITKDAYVVVQYYKDGGEATPFVIVKQFVSRSPTITVFRQLNPKKELKIPTRNILAVHRIVGTGEV